MKSTIKIPGTVFEQLQKRNVTIFYRENILEIKKNNNLLHLRVIANSTKLAIRMQYLNYNIIYSTYHLDNLNISYKFLYLLRKRILRM